MKTTLVPAQVTTVEDKIAGSLSLSQLLLLCAPIFLGSILYILFPPLLKLTLIKTLIFILLVIAFGLLSIRVRGKILLSWLIVISRYNLRPRFYIYDKNDSYLRLPPALKAKTAKQAKPAAAKKERPRRSKIPMSQMVRLQTVIADPRAKLRFRVSRKGGLDVHITEIK